MTEPTVEELLAKELDTLNVGGAQRDKFLEDLAANKELSKMMGKKNLKARIRELRGGETM